MLTDETMKTRHTLRVPLVQLDFLVALVIILVNWATLYEAQRSSTDELLRFLSLAACLDFTKRQGRQNVDERSRPAARS